GGQALVVGFVDGGAATHVIAVEDMSHLLATLGRPMIGADPRPAADKTRQGQDQANRRSPPRTGEEAVSQPGFPLRKRLDKPRQTRQLVHSPTGITPACSQSIP